MKREGFLLKLGLRGYKEVLDLQTRMNTARKQNAIPDTVIFLEHHPCITIGAHGNNDSILASRRLLKEKGIEVYETDRGGSVTYHGPGQIVCYPILDLKNHGCDVTSYARGLEEIIINTLLTFEITAGRKKGYPGVWVDEKRKIAAQGISVNGWITMHGVALNVSPVMEHFSFIIPCGLRDCNATSMKECLGRSIDKTEVEKEMIYQFSTQFGIELRDISEDLVEELIKYE